MFKTSQILILLIIPLLVSGCSAQGVKEKLSQWDKKIGEELKNIQTGNNQASSTEELEIKNNNTQSKEENKISAKGELNQATKEKIDQWLAEKKLNRYGDPVGTFYAGGTPLFNEATGETKNRFEYILSKHPDLLNDLK